MQDFVLKFGVDWKLLLSQVVNFLLLMSILRLAVYGPVIAMLRTRKEKIEKGMADADDAAKRLEEIDVLKAEEMRKADTEAQKLMKVTEERAKAHEAELMKVAETKAEHTIQEAKKLIAAKRAQMEDEVRLESISLIRKALIKTVQLDPTAVNEALIKEALKKAYKLEGSTF